MGGINMPFKSKAQHLKFRAMLADGEISQGTFDEMMKETKKKHGKKNPIKSLPEKVEKSASITALFKEAFDSYWKEASEKIKGGLADHKKPSKYSPEALKKGIKVEYEHTNDKGEAREIAMDHLEEHPDYYKALDKMENKLEKKASTTLGFDKFAEDERAEDKHRKAIQRSKGKALDDLTEVLGLGRIK